MQISLGDRDSITVLNSSESFLLDLDSTTKAFKDDLDSRLTKYVKSQ